MDEPCLNYLEVVIEMLLNDTTRDGQVKYIYILEDEDLDYVMEGLTNDSGMWLQTIGLNGMVV